MERQVQPPDLLSAREAARRLGVKLETLYAYVRRRPSGPEAGA